MCACVCVGLICENGCLHKPTQTFLLQLFSPVKISELERGGPQTFPHWVAVFSNMLAGFWPVDLPGCEGQPAAAGRSQQTQRCVILQFVVSDKKKIKCFILCYFIFLYCRCRRIADLGYSVEVRWFCCKAKSQIFSRMASIGTPSHYEVCGPQPRPGFSKARRHNCWSSTGPFTPPQLKHIQGKFTLFTLDVIVVCNLVVLFSFTLFDRQRIHCDTKALRTWTI